MGSLREAQERTPVPPRDWFVYWEWVLVELDFRRGESVVEECIDARQKKELCQRGLKRTATG
jgi:hypothetical protein